jgi:hypothetical protein
LFVELDFKGAESSLVGRIVPTEQYGFITFAVMSFRVNMIDGRAIFLNQLFNPELGITNWYVRVGCLSSVKVWTC